jgi:DNA-directed RNA polymerase subunit M/transcription elongation factor TFIIS
MIFFKACPKCHGDLYIDKDAYGQYVECLQCGYSKDLTSDQVQEIMAKRSLVAIVQHSKAA